MIDRSIHRIRRIRTARRSPIPADPFSLPVRMGGADMLEGLLRSWWDSSEYDSWWAQEVTDMQIGYPLFQPIIRRRYVDLRRIIHGVAFPETPRERVEREDCGDWVRAWRGRITPFPDGMPLAEVQAIVADLDEDRPVRVLVNGVLGHYAGCGGAHRPRPRFRLARTLHGAFDLEIAYRRPPGCPIVRSLSPRITGEHPHLFSTEALCVVFPPDGTWVSGIHTARDYATFTAIWLAKHLAWEEARERGMGVQEAWPGTAASHDPFDLLRLLGPRDPCRCGSPKQYAECCAPYDEILRKRTPRKKA